MEGASVGQLTREVTCLCVPLGDEPHIPYQMFLLRAYGSCTHAFQTAVEPNVLFYCQPVARGDGQRLPWYVCLREWQPPPTASIQVHQSSHVKQHIVLWADAQVGPDGCHVGLHIMAQDGGRATTGWEETTQDGPVGSGI